MNLKLEALLGERIWELVGRYVPDAQRHGVTALLHALKPSSAAGTDGEEFASAFRKTLSLNLLYLKETKDVLLTFQEAGISVIPLKGVLFASQFYPHLGCRPQSDVDVLVREPDLASAHECLLKSGYSEAVPKSYYKNHYHYVYEAPSGVLMELHWRLKVPGTGCLNVHRVWDNAQVVHTEGLEFPAMCPENLLAYMTLNKAQQHFSQLIDFVDLFYVVSRGQINWEKFVRGVKSDRTAGSVWFGLFHIEKLLGADVPGFVLKELSSCLEAKPAMALQKILARMGGPHRISPHLLTGPSGRIYELMLEGHPVFMLHLLRHLLLPSRGKLSVSSKGSYPAYIYKAARNLLSQLFMGRSA